MPRLDKKDTIIIINTMPNITLTMAGIKKNILNALTPH